MDIGKANRVLSIYTKLLNGSIIFKSEEANHFNVNERTIQRDIDDIRSFLDQEIVTYGFANELIYDRRQKGYRFSRIYGTNLSNEEILAICKILLDSRAFKKDEMQSILKRLIDCCIPEDNKAFVQNLIANESFHYIELNHKKSFLKTMWDIGQAIRFNKYIEIEYQGIKGSGYKKRKLKPLAIMFSEYYFYLTAFIEDEKVRENFNILNDSSPTIYRIDRIKSLNILEEKFYIPYNSRFEEGEFRKRIQFMYGGRLRKVIFEYSGISVESVLDRLPTARIIKEDKGTYTIQAEVFGDGIDMWFRSQGNLIKIIE